MYTFTSRVRFSETDENGKLSLAGIMNYLQDCSVFHSEDVGNGTDVLKKRDRVWLLNSWQIIIKKRPRCCEYIEIGTQAYQFKGTLGKRNFCIQRADGTQCVVANSNWVLVQNHRCVRCVSQRRTVALTSLEHHLTCHMQIERLQRQRKASSWNLLLCAPNI